MVDKPALVLLPGLLCDAALWRHQTDRLADVADCRVIDMTRDDDMAAMAARVLSEVPERFALCGLSMGGYCALEIMRQAPDRVDRLALLDTSARPDVSEQTARRHIFIGMVEKGDFEAMTEELVPNFVHPDHWADERISATIRGSARAVGKAAFLRQQRAIMSRPDSRPGLSTISCPTMVLCGRQDALTPLDCHEEMAAAIPGAQLVVIEDCGHLAPLEKPEETTAALRRWLIDEEEKRT